MSLSTMKMHEIHIDRLMQVRPDLGDGGAGEPVSSALILTKGSKLTGLAAQLDNEMLLTL